MRRRLYQSSSLSESELRGLLASVAGALLFITGVEDWVVLFDLLPQLHKYSADVQDGELTIPSDVEGALFSTLNGVEDVLQEAKYHAKSVGRSLERSFKRVWL